MLIVDKEKALRDEMEINDKLREAYEKLMQRLNKKKRHVGIGSHDVWRDDPQVENLKGRLNDSEDEIRKLRNELERVKGQREVSNFILFYSVSFIAPKPSKMPNHLLSNASTTKSLPARLVLAPFGLWPKLSPKTFANHLSFH